MIKQRVVMSLLVILMLLVLSPSHVQASAEASSHETSLVQLHSNCILSARVVWPTAGVYRAPGVGLIKKKHSGDLITMPSPLTAAYGPDHKLYVVVCTVSTTSGYAWMRLQALK